MRAKAILVAGPLALALFGASCSSCTSKSEEAKAPPTGGGEMAAKAPEKAAPAAEDPTNGGGPAPAAPANPATISGTISFQGTPPAPEKINMGADAYCQGQHKDQPAFKEDIVSEGGKLANVFIYVKAGIDAVYPAPKEPVVLDQVGCQYHPHVFGVIAGQPILIRNSDDTLHNIYTKPANNKGFNEGQPTKGLEMKKTLKNPEVMVKFKCDVHAWMNSYAGVLPHPFFAVSGKDGKFEIKGLPAGKYTIEAWHEKLGTQTAEITVAEKEVKTADFTFKIEAGK